ncbi:MAG: ATP-binding cassette domain-containing protein, partial [Hyphomicrobiales bacterium]
MTECMLKLENVVAGYGYGPDIIKNINLELNKGDIKCIIGPNGAGKSTVLKAIAGIIKPRNGTVVFNSDNGEINLSGMETYKIMKTGLCFIPQDRSLFTTLTVAENLAMAGYTLNDKQEVKNRTEEVLETFPRLKERLSQYAGTMSGGEQQQLIFARAI